MSSMKKKAENSTYASPTSTSKDDSKSLKEEFIYEVLGQEEAFKKYKNKQNLTKLISLYRRLVEHYSQKNDKIALYFTDKIASISCEMPMLLESEEKVTMSMIRQTSQDQKNPVDGRFKTVFTSSTNYDPEIKKKERSKNAQIAIEVNKVKKRANARTILKSYYEQWEENNKIVSQDLKNQRKQLEDKLLIIRKCLIIEDKRSLDVASKPIVI